MNGSSKTQVRRQVTFKGTSIPGSGHHRIKANMYREGLLKPIARNIDVIMISKQKQLHQNPINTSGITSTL